MAELSYIMLGEGKAKVTCTCGWESEIFDQSPFDPGEAVVAYGVEHIVCLKFPPEVYYAVAQEMHGKLIILGELLQGPGAKETMEKACQGLVPKGRTMQVVEVKVSSTWNG